MRYSASEKAEIIRLVGQSALPVKRTLEKLGNPLQVDFELICLGPIANIYPALPNEDWGRPKWEIRRTPIAGRPLWASVKIRLFARRSDLYSSFLRRLANSGRVFRRRRGMARPFEARPRSSVHSCWQPPPLRG